MCDIQVRKRLKGRHYSYAAGTHATKSAAVGCRHLNSTHATHPEDMNTHMRHNTHATHPNTHLHTHTRKA
jgi:hypothetical protein